MDYNLILTSNLFLRVVHIWLLGTLSNDFQHCSHQFLSTFLFPGMTSCPRLAHIFPVPFLTSAISPGISQFYLFLNNQLVSWYLEIKIWTVGTLIATWASLLLGSLSKAY